MSFDTVYVSDGLALVKVEGGNANATPAQIESPNTLRKC